MPRVISDVSINDLIYLSMIAEPNDPKGTVLVLQGGVGDPSLNSHYLIQTNKRLGYDYRIFVFQKKGPIISLKDSENLHDSLTYIKSRYQGKVYVIGYSAGGVLLYTYLSRGYNDADIYIPVCCPINLTRFDKIIKEHFIFNMLSQQIYRQYNVRTHEEFLKTQGICLSRYHQYIDKHFDLLNETSKNWADQTYYVIGDGDPLTHPLEWNYGSLRYNPHLLLVKGGWHCCSRTVEEACRVVFKL